MNPPNHPHEIDTYYRTHTVLPLGRHEAGHYVVARALGFTTGSIKLRILDQLGAHSGGAEIEPVRAIRNLTDALSYLGDRIQVLYAGAMAQSLVDGKVDEEAAVSHLEEGGAQNDFAKVRELLQVYRNIWNPDATGPKELQRGLDRSNDELWAKAKIRVEAEHELICGLGSRIASELKIIGQEFELSEAELDNLPVIQQRFSGR